MTEEQHTGRVSAPAPIKKFNFHGDDLDVVSTDGEHYVVLARLCEPLGLRVDGQAEKLRALPWARTQKIWVRDPRGQMQEVVCLSIRSVAGWLFTINAGKVAPHLREKLALYQRECADVLADHFLGVRRRSQPDALAESLQEVAVAVRGMGSAMVALAERLDRMDARLVALEGRPTAGPSDVLLGAAQARARVLGPLHRAAKLRAAAFGKEQDQGIVTSQRMRLDMRLRMRLGYHFGRGKSWQNLPASRLGEACVEVAALVHESEDMAKLAAKPEQLTLPTKPEQLSLGAALTPRPGDRPN